MAYQTDPAKIAAALSKPFEPSTVHWRVGRVTKANPSKALVLAYIDARHVYDRLDEVVGPANWQTAIEQTPTGRVLCTLAIKINGEWVSKTDGAGNTDVEADKGAISDAVKRAGVQWGIARYLYSLGNTFAAIDPKFKNITKPELTRLARAIEAQFKGQSDEARKLLADAPSDEDARPQDQAPADDSPRHNPEAAEANTKLNALLTEWDAGLAEAGTLADLKAIHVNMNENRGLFKDAGTDWVDRFQMRVTALRTSKEAIEANGGDNTLDGAA